jgi:hypothetical protein
MSGVPGIHQHLFLRRDEVMEGGASSLFPVRELIFRSELSLSKGEENIIPKELTDAEGGNYGTI